MGFVRCFCVPRCASGRPQLYSSAATSLRRRSAASPFPRPAPPGAAAVRARRAAAPQLRVRRRDRGVPARRSGSTPAFAMAYWGEALRLQPAALVQRERREGARGAGAAGADARRAPGEGADRSREGAISTPSSGCSATAPRRTRDRAYADRDGGADRGSFRTMTRRRRSTRWRCWRRFRQAQRDPARLAQGRRHRRRRPRRRTREHPGAAHYALHAFDDGEHAAMGLEAARIYARIAPASSHARHMPSHVFLPLGMWDEAVASDEASFAASVDRVEAAGAVDGAGRLPQPELAALRVSAAGTVREGARGDAHGRARDRVRRPRRPGQPQPAQPAHLPSSHVESEIGRGFGAMSLKSELASMRARLVVESGDWAQMKGQGELRQHRRAVRARRRQRAARRSGARRARRSSI